MSKFRALLVSSLLATALVGGAITSTTSEAKAPVSLRNGGDSWCC